MRTQAGWIGLGLLAVLCFSGSSSAYFLDDARRFDVRLKAYSQLSVMTEDSEELSPEQKAFARSFVPATAPAAQKRAAVLAITPPTYSLGDLAQHRNFYNPEFDANLTDFMQWAKADQFKFRFAWWGFYDGVYDYLNPEWADRARSYRTRFSESDNPAGESFTFNDHYKRARTMYGYQSRLNELYFDYTTGPFFIRVGKQAISWGESDSIALLDVQNPFDLSLGAPGFFQDVEEARIPLWTVRSTYKLMDQVGPVSNLFADVYMVPGPIDTTVPKNPIAAGVSPFNPDQSDPYYNIAAQGAFGKNFTTVVVDQLPEKTWANTRWGARLTGLLLRDYTVQGWFFRTFNQAPQPLVTDASAIGIFTKGNGTFVNDRGQKCDPATATGPCSKKAPAVNILERHMESVVGLAATWFSQPVNGILKWEIEYFIDELGFIPQMNLNPRVQLPAALRTADEKQLHNHAPTADYLRWVVGYDRNFFFRPLNPTNSFILVMAYNSSFNLSEKGGMDFRNANTKPGHPSTRNGPMPGNPLCQGPGARRSPICVFIDPHDYEDAYQYEGFLNTTLQTDYLHGLLTPRLTIITDVSGIFGFQPSISYRLNDNVQLGLNYLGIEAPRKSGLGTFRAHDMVQFRVTAQLN